MSNKMAGLQVQALFCIVKSHTLMERILTGFLEIGVTGASVLSTRGMGEILSQEIPIFTGFKSLFPSENSAGQMIFSVVPESNLQEVLALINDVCENFEKPGTGIVFTVPVQHVFGLKEEVK